MLTCMLLAARIVLVSPEGIAILPSDAMIAIKATDTWPGIGGTDISYSGGKIQLEAPFAEVSTVIQNCNGPRQTAPDRITRANGASNE